MTLEEQVEYWKKIALENEGCRGDAEKLIFAIIDGVSRLKSKGTKQVFQKDDEVFDLFLEQKFIDKVRNIAELSESKLGDDVQGKEIVEIVNDGSDLVVESSVSPAIIYRGKLLREEKVKVTDRNSIKKNEREY